MINFRYHLVSIVAVLLALSVGIIVGSGLLGGPLLEDLENRAETVRETNQELRDLAEERLAVIEDQERFAIESESRLLDEVLGGSQVVVIDVEGTEPDLIEGLRTAVGVAGGEVASSIRLHRKLALQSDVERDLLALAVASTSGDADQVLSDAARRLGTRIAAAAQGSPERLSSLLAQLEEGEFLSVEEGGAAVVPEGASVLLIAGVGGDPPFEVGGFVAELAGAMAARDVPVLVAEPQTSEWDVMPAVREEGDAGAGVATAGGVDLAAGRIAAIMGLALAENGEVGHFGLGVGSDLILPPPTPSS